MEGDTEKKIPGEIGMLSEEELNNTEEKAKKLLEEKDRESRVRSYTGFWGKVITFISLIFVAFQLYVTSIGTLEAMILRGWHAAFLLLLCFLIYPGKGRQKNKSQSPSPVDIFLMVLVVVVFGYFIMNYQAIALKGGYVSKFENYLGLAGVILVFIAAKRACGSLAYLALVFLLYCMLGQFIPGTFGHSGFSLKRLVGHMFWGSQGIFGVGIGVSATYIFIFVLFGSFLKYSGFSTVINDVSLALVGRSAGGPAKVSVIASALMGMINGSALANVATTGAITIPLMKKTGYKSEFAAAVEAVASTGGQFTPPVMGAVGFIMAEFLGIPYTVVLTAAIIPAFLYYVGLIMAVHFEAKRLGLKGIAKENIPDALEVLKKKGHLTLPLFILLIIMFMGYTPLYAAIFSILAAVVCSWFRKETRMYPKDIIRACEEGARSAVSVGVACVIIGVIIGTVSLTGLGLKFGYMILQFVGKGELIKGGLLVMIMSTILGMGVPGVAAYVIVTAVAVPVLIEVGALPIAAHMFCLIYACLSNITPPVAMSSYVAAGIANSDQTKTSLIAVKLGLTGFILPFFFLNNPILLLGCAPEGTATLAIVRTLLTATVGIILLAAGLEGWLFKTCGWPERILAFIIAYLFVDPGANTDLLGTGLMIILLAYQFYALKKEKKMEKALQI
ncbi:MAG: TRAP transporter permease [Clostridia bacterium]|nr:TRAP transporter permease [Clostridia bacterium]